MGNGQRPDLGFADVRRKEFDRFACEIKKMESLIPPNIYSIIMTMICIANSSSKGGKALNQEIDGGKSTRLAPELPCIRTSSA